MVLVGRTEAGEKLMLQSHINLSAADKIFLAANYLKPDHNQGIFEFEYGRKFERLDTAIKYVTSGMLSFSVVSTLAKNSFVGVEAVYNVSSKS